MILVTSIPAWRFNAVRALDGITVASGSDRTFLMHKGGKIEIVGKVPIKTRDDLSMAYTPGVGRVSMAIHDNPEDVRKLTIKGNSVAVVTDGSEVEQSTTITWEPCSEKAVHSRSSITPPKADTTR